MHLFKFYFIFFFQEKKEKGTLCEKFLMSEEKFLREKVGIDKELIK